MSTTDTQLLQASAHGDGRAFGELARRHAQDLFGLARWLVGDRADAEDVLQETLAGAYRAAGSFDGRSSVKTWLTSICIRQAGKFRGKRRKYRQTLSLNSGEDSSMREGLALVVGSGTVTVDRRIDLAQVIQSLPADHRDVLVLREVKGLSYEEIAATLAIPRGTVESRLHRARAALKRRLEGYES